MKSHPVVVALGSNLGDSAAMLLRAMDALQALSTVPLLRSSLWTSTPVDCPAGSPMFVNAVVALAPGVAETPESFLARLKALEAEFGRLPKKVLNESRPLDLDIITWGDHTQRTGLLEIPHPRAHLRRFVLQPLAEIMPDLSLPGFGRTVSELLAGLPEDEALRRISNPGGGWRKPR
jgi:2-amino-4-hydroxy-6-hydroxymethyldihydropteridine diphosphokinase